MKKFRFVLVAALAIALSAFVCCGAMGATVNRDPSNPIVAIKPRDNFTFDFRLRDSASIKWSLSNESIIRFTSSKDGSRITAVGISIGNCKLSGKISILDPLQTTVRINGNNYKSGDIIIYDVFVAKGNRIIKDIKFPNQKNLVLDPIFNKSYTPMVKVIPKNSIGNNLTWSASPNQIINVDADTGMITFKESFRLQSTYKIAIVCVSSSGVNRHFFIRVSPVSSLDITEKTIKLKVGESYIINPIVNGDLSSDPVTWAESKIGVVSIESIDDQSIKITGLKKGTTKLKATCWEVGDTVEIKIK